MRNRVTTMFAAAALIGLIPAASFAQVTAYSQDFELLVQVDPAALGNDGWLVFGNAFDTDGTTFLYEYGPFPAPNDGFGFCTIDILQGGVDQGLQQLSVFSDYNNGDHAIGRFIESNVYQEWTIDASNIGETWDFSFQHKLGNIALQSTAVAFIKTIDPANGFSLSNLVQADMTAIPVEWDGTKLSISIDAGLVGQLLQIGFANTATLFESSGIFYDNIVFELAPPIGVPSASNVLGAKLRQNYPNPFNPSTRIEFELKREGAVEIAVYDLAGRRVATLQDGVLPVGEHAVVWNGRSESGAPVASGLYNYVLKTPTGQLSRNMTLLK